VDSQTATTLKEHAGAYRRKVAPDRCGIVSSDGSVLCVARSCWCVLDVIANRLLRVTDWATGTTTYAYDPAGRLSTVMLPNGVQTTHTYDAAGRLTGLTHTKDGMVLSSYHYVLDDVGNRTHVTETGSGVTRVITYTYRCNNLSRGKSCAMIKTQGGQGQSA